jgi:hypothetical protein
VAPHDNANYVEARSGRKKLRDWPLPPPGEPGRRIEITITCQGRGCELRRDGQSVRLETPAGLLPVEPGIQPLSSCSAVVDRFEVSGVAGNGRRIVAGGGLSALPLTLDLPRLLGLKADSVTVLLPSLLLLALAALLLDLLLLRVFPRRLIPLTDAGVLLLVLPTQAALLYLLRTLLALPLFSLVLCVALLLMVRVVHAATGAPRLFTTPTDPPLNRVRLALLGVGVALHVLSVVLLIQMLARTGQSALTAGLLGAVPLVVLAAGTTLGSRHQIAAFLVCTAQLFNYYWIVRIDPAQQHLYLLLATHLPWIAATLVDLGGRTRAAGWASVALLGPVAAFALVQADLVVEQVYKE